MSTTTPGADRLQALISYSNNKTGASDTTLGDAVARLVEGYGGGSIEDGVIVTARDSNGHATAVEKYGDCGPYEFGIGTYNYNRFPYYGLETINLHDCTTLMEGAMFNASITNVSGMENITSCGANAFYGINISEIVLSKATNIGGTCFRSLGSACKSVKLPVVQTVGSFIFQDAKTLESAQLGSVGHPCPMNGTAKMFYGCTQNNLTITVYQTGSNVDTLITNLRNSGGDNATIIVKASEATTYNGTSYAAGDTILTSTPNS